MTGWCEVHNAPECEFCGGDPWPDHCNAASSEPAVACRMVEVDG